MESDDLEGKLTPNSTVEFVESRLDGDLYRFAFSIDDHMHWQTVNAPDTVTESWIEKMSEVLRDRLESKIAKVDNGNV